MKVFFFLYNSLSIKSSIAAVFMIFNFSFIMAQNETQYYKVIQNILDIEIRYYPPVMKVKTVKKGGFSSLFGYISGSNSKQQKIAMTTPVIINNYEGKGIMEFILPKDFNSQNTPLPLKSKVEIYESESGYYAAFSYSGYTNLKKEQSVIKKGKILLEKKKIIYKNQPLVLVYNSPYTLFNRKNEILFPIEYSSNQK